MEMTTSSLTSATSVETTPSKTLEQVQQHAGAIAMEFQESHFNPWITNAHAQTILGFLLRDTTLGYVPEEYWKAAGYVWNAVTEKLLKTKVNEKAVFWDNEERVETPDGDWFQADTKFAAAVNREKKNDVPTVLLLHGLESNSKSPLSREIATAYAEQGMDCVCLNFRGCSGEPNNTTRAYHLGFTDDLKHYLLILKQRKPDAPVYLSGFSLGANVVLKCLGELGEAAVHDYNVAGAAVTGAPFNQQVNTFALARPGINREVYSKNLLRSLKQKCQEHLQQHYAGDKSKAPYDYQRAMAAETITEFDDAFIAPVFGFANCWDYYEKTSCTHFLEDIAVPTLIVNAANDPFFDSTYWPAHKTIEQGGKAPVKMVRTESGGHLGFFFHRTSDERLLAAKRRPSWAASEMARFVRHVHQHPKH
jgi:predicted alpha/beta-fold hydrolase